MKDFRLEDLAWFVRWPRDTYCSRTPCPRARFLVLDGRDEHPPAQRPQILALLDFQDETPRPPFAGALDVEGYPDPWEDPTSSNPSILDRRLFWVNYEVNYWNS